MKRAIYIFTVMLALVLSYFGTQKHIAAPTIAQIESSTSSEHHKQHPGLLSDTNPLEHDATCTVIAEAQNILRICNSRPQRVITPVVSRSTRSQGGTLATLDLNNTIHHSVASRRATAPFMSPSVCGYYVYALRHILC